MHTVILSLPSSWYFSCAAESVFALQLIPGVGGLNLRRIQQLRRFWTGQSGIGHHPLWIPAVMEVLSGRQASDLQSAAVGPLTQQR